MPARRDPYLRVGGVALVTYAQAADILGIPVGTLRKAWLESGWLGPAPYRQGRRRFLLLEDVTRVQRARSRLASPRLLDASMAADRLGVSVRRLRQLVTDGRIRPVRPELALFARDDVDRLFLALRGIHDPISQAEALRLSGADRSTFNIWRREKRVPGVQLDRAWYFSRREIARLGERRTRLEAQRRAGELLTLAEAASALGACHRVVYDAVRAGKLRSVTFPPLRGQFLRRADVERARGVVKGPRRFGVPQDLLTTREAAALLEVPWHRIRDLVSAGRLRPAMRGAHGATGFRRADVERVMRRYKGLSCLVTASAAMQVLGVTKDDLRVLVRDGIAKIAGRTGNRFFYDPSALAKLRAHSRIDAIRRRIARRAPGHAPGSSRACQPKPAASRRNSEGIGRREGVRRKANASTPSGRGALRKA